MIRSLVTNASASMRSRTSSCASSFLFNTLRRSSSPRYGSLGLASIGALPYEVLQFNPNVSVCTIWIDDLGGKELLVILREHRQLHAKRSHNVIDAVGFLIEEIVV